MRRALVAAVLTCVSAGAVSADVAALPRSVGPVPGEGAVPTDPDLPAVATDAGDLVVVTGANSNDELQEGDSNTVFSVRLPDGATCPGDSANDGWRVQTFIVPAANDLGRLDYGATRPRGDFMYGLYTTEGRPYTQILLAQNPGPGIPGVILAMPALSFAPFTPDLLPVGRYRIGVACSYFEVGERYWDAELELTEDTGVEPGQRRWRVIGPDGTPAASDSADDGSSALAIVLAVAAIFAVGGAIAFVTLGRRRAPQPVKEHAR